MGVIDKFKDLVGIEEYDEDVYDEEEAASAAAQMERQRVEPRANYSQRTRDKVLSMPRDDDSLKLVVTEPAGFEECPRLVDSLKARKPVIINLEKTDSDTARKIFDFLSGATYAINGTVQKVANNIFIFAPENIDISAGAAEMKGFDFNRGNENWR